MSSTTDVLAQEPASSSSLNSEDKKDKSPKDGPPFMSRREFRAQLPDVVQLKERHLRGETTHEEVMAAIQTFSDYWHTLRTRERAFGERERRGEVTQAERQREYGWTDEELHSIRSDIKMSGEVLSHNIASCKDRIVLYRSSGGH